MSWPATASRCRSCRWATSSSACSRRAATTSTRTRPTTRRTSTRRTATSPSISGCGTSFGAHAVVHLGKHGNLEWLPGKATALSADCLPEAVLGPLPHLYPFIVNDPGEGTQAKRRAGAVDRRPSDPAADPGRELGRARRARGAGRRVSRGVRPRPAPPGAAARAASSSAASALGPRPRSRHRPRCAAGRASGAARQPSVRAQGAADPRRAARVRPRRPRASQLTDLLVALARAPRGAGEGGDASLLRALAARSGAGLGPAGRHAGRAVAGPRPSRCWRARRAAGAPRATRSSGWSCWPAGWSPASWQPSRGWTGDARGAGTSSSSELRPARGSLRPSASWRACCAGSTAGACRPGPSGAPTRGRPDVLPTGRNFYSVDCRAVPTPAAWQLGWRSAELVVEQYLQRHGDWPAPGGAVGLGHRQHAHRRRRHRPGAGADGLPPGLGRRQPAGHRRRGAAARRCWAGRGSTSRCASPASSATPSRPRSSCSTTPAGRWPGWTSRRRQPAGGGGARTSAARLVADRHGRRRRPGGGRRRGSSAASPAPTAPGCRR